MRAGIEITVTPEHRRRLESIARDRNAAQKHVARAKVILVRHPQTPQGPGLALTPSPVRVPLHPDFRSWLNAVETFFAALTKRRLRRGVFRSVVDVQAAIHRYISKHNIEPKPFVWTADPDCVLAAIRRGQQALESAP